MEINITSIPDFSPKDEIKLLELKIKFMTILLINMNFKDSKEAECTEPYAIHKDDFEKVADEIVDLLKNK